MNGPLAQPRVALIAAVADNGVIGRDNRLLWRQREDMRHFKALTLDHAVLMGRKTWESLGRPLPQRRNIVITRNADLRVEGAERAGSLAEALAHCTGEDRAFVIGGGEIYAQALDLADLLYLTEVHCRPEGDTLFPEFDRSLWREAERRRHVADEHNEHDCDFVTLVRA